MLREICLKGGELGLQFGYCVQKVDGIAAAVLILNAIVYLILATICLVLAISLLIQTVIGATLIAWSVAITRLKLQHQLSILSVYLVPPEGDIVLRECPVVADVPP